MIRNCHEFDDAGRDSCGCANSRHRLYDYFNVNLTRDDAWALVMRLLEELQGRDEKFGLTFHEDVTPPGGMPPC